MGMKPCMEVRIVLTQLHDDSDPNRTRSIDTP
jgi:hypothetical protein